MTPDATSAVLAQIDEALGCLLGEAEQTSDGGRTWEQVDPLGTGMAVHMRLANRLFRSPAVEAWADQTQQCAIALTLARQIITGEVK